MDVYWSIEHCGWVPCKGPQEPLATPWLVAEVPAELVHDLPQQRVAVETPVPAEG